MKPEFTRPFDLDHAMSGAPIATADRGPARFVAYVSHADSSCRAIILDKNGVVGTRRESGRTNECGAIDNPHDLVMIPLGMIDGKPVFVGDEYVFSGVQYKAQPAGGDDFIDCTWPAPEKVYPVTQMTAPQIMDVVHATPGNYTESYIAIANAALRHAIDAGQIVTKDEHESALIRLGEHLRGIAIAPDAARDMAIAEAVKAEAMRIADIYSTACHGQLRAHLVPAAIIATIK